MLLAKTFFFLLAIHCGWLPCYMKFLWHIFAILECAYFATLKFSDFAKNCILNNFNFAFLSNTKFISFRLNNFITKKGIDVCFQKMLSCLSIISFNKINMIVQFPIYIPLKRKFAFVLNTTCPVPNIICLQLNSDLVSEKSVNFVFVILEEDGN